MGRFRWSVGVTTSLRDGANYLPTTLQSIAAAGWESPTVYSEPGSPVPATHRASESTVAKGPWPNFFRAVGEMVAKRPAADAYLIFQDDIYVCRDLRAWLEPQLWPTVGKQPGVLSLYTSEFTQRDRPRGWFEIVGDDLPRRCYGALAIVLPAASARRLLLARPGRGALAMTEIWLGRFCREKQLPWVQHCPGFVEHIGDASTRRRDWNAKTPARRAGKWLSFPPSERP